MKSKNFVVGLVVFLIGVSALGVGGYFLYSNLKNGGIITDNNGSSNNNNNNDDLDFGDDFELDVSKAVPNDDPTSYKIIEAQNLRYTYSSISKTTGLEGLTPSHGSPNILVVPVEFRDLTYKCTWNDSNLRTLNAAFNGTKEDHTNDYSESVRSFYNKSSYGSLDLNFTITDTLTPSITSTQFVSLEADRNNEALGTYRIVEDFYAHGQIDGRNIDFDSDIYDINNDDYVDGVWFIYNDKGQSHQQKKKYWPYVFWYMDNEMKPGKNYISCYANCSFAFLFEGTRTGQDYHTLVHETGHLMGLDDYYSYDDEIRTNAALGGLDMMDLNIGDHNAFSKTALGWTNPIIPKKSGSFKLRPFAETGDCIILSNDFNDSAFAEYIILEYYTPTNLNRLDATVRYPNRPNYFSEPGLRAYHVDARLLKLHVDFATGGIYPADTVYYPTSHLTVPKPTNRNPYYCIVSSSNTRSRNNYAYGESRVTKDLIAAIDANNRTIYNGVETDNNTLFKVGDRFSPRTYSKFFNGNKFYDGTLNSFEFNVTNINSDNLTVNIEI